MTKDLGAIYTPEGYASILVNWAIQSKNDKVLDLGIGEGVFVFHAYKRLVNLGAKSEDAVQQVFGSEIDSTTFNKFIEISKSKGLSFKNVNNKDFFDVEIPCVDTIVGNPPYVRRRVMSGDYLDSIREKTLCKNPFIRDSELSHLSDLYIYFLLAALPMLKPGGRLAIVIADSWLNARYGEILKKYLISEFEISQIVSIDRKVFENVEVKAVLILASKKNNLLEKNDIVKFVRLRNGMPLEALSVYVSEGKNILPQDIVERNVEVKLLDPQFPWAVFHKSSMLLDQIISKGVTVPFKELADIQIGLQTLAEDFFVLTHKEKEDGIVEDKYLVPFVYHVASFSSPVITADVTPSHYLFHCPEPKEKLGDTNALKYILFGESTKVAVRGKGTFVIGYQNKERIKKAHRKYWYYLKKEIDKRVKAQILIPRFIYEDYSVLWNAAGYIPGGAVLQCIPKQNELTTLDIRVYLAILTSSFSEIIFRIYSQVYGGGSFNLRISTLKNAPMINIKGLTLPTCEKLVNAFERYLEKSTKEQIDHEVYTILGLTDDEIVQMKELLLDLKGMAISAKKAAHPELIENLE